MDLGPHRQQKWCKIHQKIRKISYFSAFQLMGFGWSLHESKFILWLIENSLHLYPGICKNFCGTFENSPRGRAAGHRCCHLRLWNNSWLATLFSEQFCFENFLRVCHCSFVQSHLFALKPPGIEAPSVAVQLLLSDPAEIHKMFCWLQGVRMFSKVYRQVFCLKQNGYGTTSQVVSSSVHN